NNFMEIIYHPFVKPFEEKNKDIEIFNIMDDSLLLDTRKYDEMTPDIASRMYHYAKAAEDSGAHGILVTCTSVNQATKYIKPLLNIPILNIEEPVATAAVKAGKRIGILATLPTSPMAIGRVIQEKADQMGKEIDMVTKVVDGAFDVLCKGNRKEHDQMVCEALYQLAEEVDVIAFAQISMSLLKFEPVKTPVFMIGESGLEMIKAMMTE
ncbi:MAG TPA: aspartate/glutamate racemase family protein, partial [Candidatus Merdenecus merdavium]|nr:aspartate/glutamate racemase family protein [Candidatus Merdenecus merdavium]